MPAVSATHGHVPGYPPGREFDDRAACCNAGVHAATQAGIQGRKDAGAFSVVLSGGYEDDEDHGTYFYYTGAGGREDRSAVQTAHQEWENYGNAKLLLSHRLKQPIRVIRGSRHKSRYAPAQGFRYDGLYMITEAWDQIGKAGFKMCRFLFQKLKNQNTLPKNWLTAELWPVDRSTWQVPDERFAFSPRASGSGQATSTMLKSDVIHKAFKRKVASNQKSSTKPTKLQKLSVSVSSPKHVADLRPPGYFAYTSTRDREEPFSMSFDRLLKNAKLDTPTVS